MKDLVETVIGQVMRQDTAYAPSSSPRRMPGVPQHRVKQLSPAGGAHGAAPAENDPLWQASRKFEALFVEQMLTSMRKSVPESGLLNKGFAEGVSTSMMDQAVADSIGRQGRMGIATSLYRQLSHESSQAAQVNPENGDKQISPAAEAQASPVRQVRAEGEHYGTH